MRVEIVYIGGRIKFNVMKKIIVAIDFSSCSVHALDYAISIAKLVDANIQLVWVDSEVNHDTDLIVTEIEAETRKDKSKILDELIDKYSDKLNGKLSYKFRTGRVYQEISLLAKSEKADLIIVGTHGASGYEEYWIGSNAYRIVTHAPCPVITMRQQFKIRDRIDKIVIPIDASPETLHKLEFIKNLALIFNAEVHVVSIFPTMIEALKRKVEINEKKAIQFLNENKINFVDQMVKSDKLTKTIVEYAIKIDADLIGIMTEQGSTKTSVFLGPNAQQLISNSTIPVLNVRPQN